MKKCTMASMLGLSLLIFSCKKDKDKERTPEELLMGKWIMTEHIIHSYSSTRDVTDTAREQDLKITLEFLDNGKAVEQTPRTVDTFSYKLIDNAQKLVLASDTMAVNALTGNQLKTYRKEVYSSSAYDEYFINYRR